MHTTDEQPPLAEPDTQPTDGATTPALIPTSSKAERTGRALPASQAGKVADTVPVLAERPADVVTLPTGIAGAVADGIAPASKTELSLRPAEEPPWNDDRGSTAAVVPEETVTARHGAATPPEEAQVSNALISGAESAAKIAEASRQEDSKQDELPMQESRQPEARAARESAERSKGGEPPKGTNFSNVNQAESIVNNFIFQHGTRGEFPREDPTGELPELDAGTPPAAAAVDAQVARLLSERIMVITAVEDADLLGAVQAVFKYPSLAGRQARFVRKVSNAPLDQQFMLDDLTKLPVGAGKAAVVLIMAEDNEPVGLIPHTPVAIADLRTRLKAKDILVVVACTDMAGLPKPLRIHRWNAAPPSGTGAAEMSTDQVESAVNAGEPGDSLLRLTALYVATQFDRVPIGDFERVMALLLDGKTVERVEPANAKPHFGSRGAPRSRTVAAMDAWREQGDAILTRLRVVVRTDHDGRKTLAFANASARQEAEQYLERSQALFRDRQFDTLLASGVVLSPGVSDTMADRTLNLLAAMLRSDPERSQRALADLAEGVVRSISGPLGYIPRNLNAAAHPERRGSSSLGEALRRLFGRRRQAVQQNRLLERTAKLFATLEADPALQTVAWSFLDGLFGHVPRTFISDLLHIIAEDRRYQPSALFWRRLRDWFDTASSEQEENQYYEFLTRYLARSDGTLFEVLGHLVHWLPEKGKEASTPSSKAALSIVRDYLLYNLQGVVDDVGQGPATPPLLAAIADDTEGSRRYRVDLVRWFFHSAWGSSDLPLDIFDFTLDPEETRKLNRDTMALLFVSCVVQLLIATGDDAPPPANAALAQSLLSIAHDELGRPDHLWFRGIMADYHNRILAVRTHSDQKQHATIDAIRRAHAEAVRIWNSFRKVAVTEGGKDAAPSWFF